MTDLSIAVFASGSGTNLQALMNASKGEILRGEVAAVISNNSRAYALERARKENIPAYHISGKTYSERTKFVSRLFEVFDENNINLVVLAGYMKLVPIEVVRKYRSRIINIHPALLPGYGGKGMYGTTVHKAVIESGDRLSGATVHIVDEIYDHGAILIQRTVPVLADDTPESLAARVLKVEHEILPEAAAMFL
ncbi:MAG: phosphoribosylglycinamide formyltransferase [candidate division Zixibacteria bacterium]